MSIQSPRTNDSHNNPNLLAKTRAYCIGHMQYGDGRGWRDYVINELTPLGIQIFNPYDKPFIKDVDETEEAFKQAYKDLKTERYDLVVSKMKEIRSYDLSLVDRSDFIIAVIDVKIPSWGTGEELSWAARLKRPTFICSTTSKSDIPLWVYGMFPHKYMYDSIEDAVDMIKKIDRAEIITDSNRWRLLRKELR